MSLLFNMLTNRRRQWLPTPVLLPRKSRGWRSLVGCSPWDRWESDTTERVHFHALEKDMATYSSLLACRIPGTEEPGRLQSMGSLSRIRLSKFTFTFHFHALEKEWQPTPVFLPGESQGRVEPGGLPSMGSHRVGHD